MTEIERTFWRCELCGTTGRIEYVAHSSVYEVATLLEEAHKAASPGCGRYLSKIRVSLEPFAAAPTEERTNE